MFYFLVYLFVLFVYFYVENFITYFQFWDFDHYLDFVLLYWFLMYLLGAIKTILLFFFTYYSYEDNLEKCKKNIEVCDSKGAVFQFEGS